MGLKDIFFGDDTQNAQTNEAAPNTDNAADSQAADATAPEGGIEEITKDMLICDIISKHPFAAQFLMDCGMECIFCPASQMESLFEACAVHGIDADEICAELNQRMEEHAQM